KVLQWFTGNIGLHHIHHLSSRIPNYRLQKVLDEVPALQNAPRLTFWKSLRCATLTLWDEQQQKLTTYRAARKAFKNQRALETAA
ncbi:MAG TPA: fatty acid desaturase, partial [Thermoanaerobaculia bacterium]|nr:fatty acid desaturase [Thermoanaerobaculia bacterium]